ncbi:MAG: hypothetical protein MJ250_07220, partial [Alphaproteobacteria bacterium]|nr:hypothetical protein [Alphaproteobacteria bacterium]
MSDKLEWQNRHLALIRYTTLDEVTHEEHYEQRPDLASFYKKTNVEDIVWDFADAGRYKCACELLGYIGHRRAVVWWGYLCLLSLYEELKQNPIPVVEVDQIGKSFEPKVPDFAKVKTPKPSSEQIAKAEKVPALMKEKLEKVRKMCNPELLAEFNEYMEVFYSEFEKVHHIRPLDLIKKLQDINKQEVIGGRIDMNSPIFKEAEKIKSQLQTVRKETLDTIHAVLPPEMPEIKLKKAKEALRSVYNWVVAPDEVNAKKCMDMGNSCPDTPAGVLSYCAFWAWGDMMPGEGKKNIVVKTPPGLMSNGFSQMLLMCALQKGGTRKLKERYEEYFHLGIEVLTGKNLWDE